MPKFTVEVPVGEIMDKLGMRSLPADCHYRRESFAEFEVEIDQDDIDEEATPADPGTIYVDARDLRDGLRALIAGDFSIASILLIRALDEDEDAKRVIEEECRAAGRKRAA